MSKKTKKSSGKSDKERQMLLHQRSQAEAELKKKEEEEMLGLFLKDKRQDEQRNMAVTKQKIKDGWREIHCLAQDPDLLCKIIMCQQMFEKEVDDLESIIKKNKRDAQEMDHWEAQVKRCQLKHMEVVLALQAKHLPCLEQQSEGSLQEIGAGWSWQQRMELEDQLENLQLTAEQQNQDEIQAFYETTQTNSLETLEEQIAVGKFSEDVTEDTQRNTEGLQHSSNLPSGLTDKLTKTLKLLSDGLKANKKLEKNICQLTTERKEEALKEEALMEGAPTATINEAKQQSRALWEEEIRDQKAAQEKLGKLVMQSGAAIKKLETVIAKGESVFYHADICEKLERKYEALLGFSSGPTDEASTTPAEEVCNLPGLQQLDRHINNAIRVRDDLNKKNEELRCENRDLKHLINQYKNAPTLHVTPAPTTSTPPGASSGRSINAKHIPRKKK